MINNSTINNKSLYEMFKGPHKKDYEYEKISEEYQITKGRMLSLKSVIDTYPSRLEGYKSINESFISNLQVFCKSNNKYYQFISNVIGAHKNFSSKLIKMFSELENMKEFTNEWNDNSSSVDAKLAFREEKRKNYEHYDKKLAELFEERNKIISEGRMPEKKDDDKLFKYIKKFQNSANEYIKATNEAFKHLYFFLDSKNNNIMLSIVGFLEIEIKFFNEVSYIFNYFKNCRNNIMEMIQNSNSPEINYDASNFIRGKSLLNLSIEEIQRCLTISPNYMENRGNNQNINANVNNNNGFNNISKSVNIAMINPFSNDNNFNNYNNSSNNGFSYNNNLNASTNYVSNPYMKNKIDNSIPDPFSCDPNNNYRNGNNDDHGSLNPYNAGNNNIDNPFK